MTLDLAFTTQPITGWRIWRVTRVLDQWATAHDLATHITEHPDTAAQLFQPRLRSLTQPTTWPTRERMTAACTHGHPHPHPACECGTWAYTTKHHAIDTLTAYRYASTPIALGQVSLWGHVIQHEHGYRAQHAYPTTLTLYGAPDPATAPALERAYGVPATTSTWPHAHTPVLPA